MIEVLNLVDLVEANLGVVGLVEFGNKNNSYEF